MHLWSGLEPIAKKLKAKEKAPSELSTPEKSKVESHPQQSMDHQIAPVAVYLTPACQCQQ